MTAHELAHDLLEMENLPVVCMDGLDPSDPVEIEDVEIRSDLYFSRTACHKGENYILLF